MAISFFYIYVMATIFFYIYVMATSFFYIYVMANSFFYIYIDTYIDIYIDIYELAERPVVLLNAIFIKGFKIKFFSVDNNRSWDNFLRRLHYLAGWMGLATLAWQFCTKQNRSVVIFVNFLLLWRINDI